MLGASAPIVSGDDKVSRREAEQSQDRILPGQPLTRSANIPMDLPENDFPPRNGRRKRAEQCDDHGHDRGEGRQQAGVFKGNGRLVGERGEIIHARQAHDPKPEGLLMRVRGRGGRGTHKGGRRTSTRQARGLSACG